MVGKPVSLVQKLIASLTKYFTLYIYICMEDRGVVVVVAVAISVLMYAHVFDTMTINT
jgi:hypothetical protein